MAMKLEQTLWHSYLCNWCDFLAFKPSWLATNLLRYCLPQSLYNVMHLLILNIIVLMTSTCTGIVKDQTLAAIQTWLIMIVELRFKNHIIRNY